MCGGEQTNGCVAAAAGKGNVATIVKMEKETKEMKRDLMCDWGEVMTLDWNSWPKYERCL
jgi:hypothetical protein